MKALYAALMEIQKELKQPKKDSTNPFFSSSYADLSSCWEAVKPLLHKHGVLLTQTPMINLDAQGPVLDTTITHVESGERRTGILPLLPVKANDPQALGACITYMRRYALCTMLGLCPEDDDGNQASGREKAKPAPQKGKPRRGPLEPGRMDTDKPAPAKRKRPTKADDESEDRLLEKSDMAQMEQDFADTEPPPVPIGHVDPAKLKPCKYCGEPMHWYNDEGKWTPMNEDGSRHRDTCGGSSSPLPQSPGVE